MITVKLYGLLRIDSGIKECVMEAVTIRDVFDHLILQGLSQKAVVGCIILINGKAANKRSKLQDGDVVQLLPPVAGG